MNRQLRNLIQATIAEFPNGSTDEIAQIVANNTTPRDMLTFYRELLLTPVRSVGAEMRRKERENQRPAKPQSPPRGPHPSAKLADRRTWWQQQLASEIVLGAGTTKTLADCTMEDLRLAVKECDAAIGRHEARMSLYVRLISQMTTRGAHRVRELPEQQPVIDR